MSSIWNNGRKEKMHNKRKNNKTVNNLMHPSDIKNIHKTAKRGHTTFRTNDNNGQLPTTSKHNFALNIYLDINVETLAKRMSACRR